MHQNYKKIWCSLIVLCLISYTFCNSISADDVIEDSHGTYAVINPDGSCVEVMVISNPSGSYPNRKAIYSVSILESLTEIRSVIIQNGSEIRVFYVSKDPFKIKTASKSYNDGNFACQLTNNATTSNVLGPTVLYGSDEYYVYQFTYGTLNSAFSVYETVTPLVEYNTTLESFQENGLYYTFGEGAQEESIEWGEPVVGFYTRFAYSGQQNSNNWRKNIDVITWESVDSRGNNLINAGVWIELRVVPAIYQASSYNDLIVYGLQNLMEFIFDDPADVSTLGWYLPQSGYTEITWNQVTNILSPVFMREVPGSVSPFSFQYQNMWAKEGWCYQARLVETETYEELSDWVTIYTSTNIGDDSVIKDPSVSPKTVNIFEEINEGNDTENNWYIENIEINMSDDDGDDTTDKPWWSYLLEAIVSLLNKIIDLFGGIFDGIVDFLLGLFDGFDPVGSFIQWWNDLKDNFFSIDLTDGYYNLPEEDLTSFSILPRKTLEIFTLNDLGFIIFIPLLIFIVRLLL